MTTTYDPKHPTYLDEADVRNELTRVYDICHGCQLCVEFCSSFPTLFEMIDRHADQDAGRMTPADQDQVVDECFQCKRCSVNCPYVPGLHDWNVDFPRLMLRATAMQHHNGIQSIRSRRTVQVLARADLLGKIATTFPRITNWVIGAKAGSLLRRASSAVTGVSSVRLLPTFAKQRFSTWFDERPRRVAGGSVSPSQGSVTIFPTCFVEYQHTDVGTDLVKVYELNGIDCSISDAGCCGAPWLHSGDVSRFTKVAKKNVSRLAAEIRDGTDVVVLQPTCGYILKHDYVAYVGGVDAELVAAHTFDACEYLMNVNTAEDTRLDTAFDGDAVEQITYHVSGHLLAQNSGLPGRDLMELTGAKVTMVQQASGVEGLWGIRAGNDEISGPIAAKLGALIDRSGGGIMAGDCLLSNAAIIQQTGRNPQHPVQVIARAYGIPPEH